MRSIAVLVCDYEHFLQVRRASKTHPLKGFYRSRSPMLKDDGENRRDAFGPNRSKIQARIAERTRIVGYPINEKES